MLKLKVFYFLFQQTAKIADIFAFIGYLNLKDFLVNGDN